MMLTSHSTANTYGGRRQRHKHSPTPTRNMRPMPRSNTGRPGMFWSPSSVPWKLNIARMASVLCQAVDRSVIATPSVR